MEKNIHRKKRIFGLKNQIVKKYFIYALILGMILLLIFYFTPLLFIIIFMAINGIVGFFQRPFRSLGIVFEVGIFATVILSCVYGPKAGVIGGLMVVLAKLILESSFSIYAIMVVFTHIFIGILPYYFFNPTTMNITTIGIGFTIFNALLMSVLSFFLAGANIAKIAMFWFTNVPLNIFMFTYFAPYVVNAMI